MANIIEAKDLTRKYEDGDSTTTALDNVSIKLPEGESIAIIGTSGSGKTTLLQLLGGLDYPTSGEVFVDGKSLKDFNDNELSNFRNKTIGFVFQFFHLQDYLTAKENVALPLIVGGEDSDVAHKKAEKLLEKVGLSHRINHTPKKMSGGEMQRVAFAIAIVRNLQRLVLYEVL